jgi:hypothetical protein
MQPIDRICTLFDTFAPADVQRLGQFYRQDAAFKDPFHEVVGLPAIQRIFGAMFETMDEPRFTVTTRLAHGPDAVLLWDLRFGLRGSAQVLKGASHLVLDADGMIVSHRDYWDPAEGLYEKLPVLGALMRWVKAQVAARTR